jgi:hypothetical protein
MTIQWADDFSRYGIGAGSTAFMLDGLPYGNIGSGASGGRVEASPDPNDEGQRAFKIGTDGNNWPRDFRTALPTVVSGTAGVAFRAWLDNLPTTTSQRCALVGFQRANGDYIAYVRVEQNGALTVQARVGDVLTEIFNSINPIVQPRSFNHFELVHNRATGEGEVYVNGVLRVSYTGVDTADNIAFINITNRSGTLPGVPMWVKDFLIWDGTGSQNNTVAGTVIVRRLKPNADNTLGGWVPNTGATGFNLLAKDTPNDATYLAGDDTPPAPMAFDLENLPPDITSVRALVSVTRMRKVDGGDANVQTALSPDNVNWDDGADRPITSAFSYYFDVSELDPASATPWAPTAVDTALLRIDRTV